MGWLKIQIVHHYTFVIYLLGTVIITAKLLQGITPLNESLPMHDVSHTSILKATSNQQPATNPDQHKALNEWHPQFPRQRQKRKARRVSPIVLAINVTCVQFFFLSPSVPPIATFIGLATRSRICRLSLMNNYWLHLCPPSLVLTSLRG